MQPPQQPPREPQSPGLLEVELGQRSLHAGALRDALPACACCGATTHLVAGDDMAYTLFCLECLWPVDPEDPYVELGGSG